MVEESVEDERTLDQMNINELRALAREKGLDHTGKKPDILARLQAPVLGPIETQLQASRAEIASYRGDRVIGVDAGAYQTKVFDSRGNVVVVRNLVADLLPGRGIRGKVEAEGGRVFEDGDRNVVLGDDVVKFLPYVALESVRSPVKEPGKLADDLGVYERVVPFALSLLGTPLQEDERVYVAVLVPGEAEASYRTGLKNQLLRLSHVDGKRVRVDGVRSVPEAFAEGLAILSASEYLPKNAVLNTGHRTSDVAVMLGDEPLPQNLRTVHVGGHDVTLAFEKYLRAALDDAGYNDVRLTPEQVHRLKEANLHLFTEGARPHFPSVDAREVEVPVGWGRTDRLKMKEGVDAPYRELVEAVAPKVAGLLKQHPVENLYVAGGNVTRGAEALLRYTLANLPSKDRVDVANVYRVSDAMAGVVGAVLHDIRHGYKGRQRTVV